MSEEEQEVSETSYFEDIGSMLDALVPPSEVLVTDINGKEHRLSGALPARRQVKVFREFQAIWKHEDVSKHLEEAQDLDIGSIVGAIVGISFNDDVLDALGRAFKEAFPSAVEGDPLDHFAIEEVVAALVPLFLRFVKRAGKTLLGIGRLATQV